MVTVGVFDGVHLGHKHLFKELKREAERSSNQAAVVTFLNHPNSVLRPDFRLRFITSIEDRVALIRESGIDLVVQATFDLDLSRLSARDFSSLLFRKLKMKQLVVETERAWQSLGKVTYGPMEAEKSSLVFRRSIYIAEDMKKSIIKNH